MTIGFSRLKEYFSGPPTKPKFGGWNRDLLYKNTTHEGFEYLIGYVFAFGGYDIGYTGGGSDGGVDVVGKHQKTGEKVMIEAKHYKKSNTVGGPIVQKAFAAAQTQDADTVYIITTSRFTRPAKKQQEKLQGKAGMDVKLINGNELCKLAKRWNAPPPWAKNIVEINE